jgi:hypothetical protein
MWDRGEGDCGTGGRDGGVAQWKGRWGVWVGGKSWGCGTVEGRWGVFDRGSEVGSVGQGKGGGECVTGEGRWLVWDRGKRWGLWDVGGGGRLRLWDRPDYFNSPRKLAADQPDTGEHRGTMRQAAG